MNQTTTAQIDELDALLANMPSADAIAALEQTGITAPTVKPIETERKPTATQVAPEGAERTSRAARTNPDASQRAERLPTDTDRYSQLPHHVIRSPEYHSVLKKSKLAGLVLIEMVLRAGFQAKDNGKILIPLSQVRGWASKRGLSEALQLLSERGFIAKTRDQRWPNDPDLWALTFFPISDDVARHVGLRCGAEATHAWRRETPAFVSPRAMHDANAIPKPGGTAAAKAA